MLIFIILNLVYLGTQFLNPGIVNLSSIREEEYEKNGGRFFCIDCNGDRTKEMKHCKYCQVCVWGLDHHCGYFNKCVAGYQKYAYFGLLIMAFISFLGVLVLLVKSTEGHLI